MTPADPATIAPKKPILARDTEALPGDLPRGSDIPADLDPLGDGILMLHQKEWLEDKSDLKIAEKGRRTGITFAEALDDTLIAASSLSAGGDDVFYIGDTKDKGREFIKYVSDFARAIHNEVGEIEEFMETDKKGAPTGVTAFRVRFKSGFKVEALSSNPANIRGRQGVVVIDEAAFHKDVREVIDAVNALLIWGGKVRVISTHNGRLNPFNELISEAKAGKNPFKVHHIPFQKAVDNGLYQRVCLIKGKTWTQEAQDEWEQLIRGSYGGRTAAMRQELDAIPADMEGAALTRVQIENCMEPGIPLHVWRKDDDFKNAPDELRKKAALEWCKTYLDPVLDALDEDRRYFVGEDFARSGDASDIVVMELGKDLVRRVKLIVELRNIPFDQQRDVFYYVCDALGSSFAKGALDSGGNGAYLAEKATQKYGTRIVEVSFSRAWYSLEMPPYIEAFSDKTIVLPQHEDVLSDHQALQYDNGIIKVPKDFRFKGSDGLDRHGDTAIAGALAYFASRQDYTEYDYRSAGRDARSGGMTAEAEDPAGGVGRPWYRPPMGARMRGGI